MAKTLHFDSVGGASGDMVLGALIDLGVPVTAITDALASLGTAHFELAAEPHTAHGLHGTRVTVRAHEHGHHHDHGHGHPPHRSLGDIRRAILASTLPAPVKQSSVAVFTRLAEAEARVHRSSVEQVHFHEVGALDAIADICGACLALDRLGVDAVSVGPLPYGHGTITCAHGVLPNPPPGTVELLKGLPVTAVDEPFELVTPTGAALLSTWRTLPTPPAGAVIVKIGHGFGQRDLNQRPNLLRAVLFEQPAAGPTPADDTSCLVLETNLDDMNPEWIGALVSKLLAAGALDVFTTAIQMKKQRPGILLTVLGTPARREALLDLIFAESTTFGVREYLTHRTVLPREFEEVDTPYGRVRIKIGRWRDRPVTAAPEYEDCARCADTAHVALRTVYEAAQLAWRARTPAAVPANP